MHFFYYVILYIQWNTITKDISSPRVTTIFYLIYVIISSVDVQLSYYLLTPPVNYHVAAPEYLFICMLYIEISTINGHKAVDSGHTRFQREILISLVSLLPALRTECFTTALSIWPPPLSLSVILTLSLSMAAPVKRVRQVQSTIQDLGNILLEISDEI